MPRVQDAAYSRTRRDGAKTKRLTASITRKLDSTWDPKTGAKTPTETTTQADWLVKEPTAYSRYMRADAAGEKVGSTTFVAYLPDLDFTSITQEAYVMWGSERYEVESSWIEDNAFIITAKRVA